MGTLINAWVIFHTTDDDKDGDTTVEVTLKDDRNNIVASLSDMIEKFPDHTSKGPFQLVITNPVRKERMARGIGSVKIFPTGDDEWHFRIAIQLLFSDGTTMNCENTCNLAEDRNEASIGVLGTGVLPEMEEEVGSAQSGLTESSTRPDIDPVAIYNIIAKNSGLCLNVAGGSNERGAPIIQWTKSETDNENWNIIPIENGFFNIIAKSSGLCLNVSEASEERGAAIIQWPKSETDNEKWSIISDGNGFFKIIAKNSGLCLNVSGGSTERGAPIIQWPQSDTDNERWSIVKIVASTINAINPSAHN